VDAGTPTVLTDNGVQLAPVACAWGSGIAFPIVGGSVNPKTAAGTTEHAARVSGTSTRVPLLKLDTSKASISSGTVPCGCATCTSR